jgi:hypothetical protein
MRRLPWQDRNWRVEEQAMTARIAFAGTLVASLCLLQACANPESRQAAAQAAQADSEKKDDATCREKGLTPGTETYDACRNTLTQARADEAAAQERRRIEFQRTIGAGTSDYTGH